MQVFPLPVDGVETKVVADDEDVQKYMIELSESLEMVSQPLIPPSSSGVSS